MESLANKFDGAVPPLVITICILLILVGIVKLTDYLDIRKQNNVTNSCVTVSLSITIPPKTN